MDMNDVKEYFLEDELDAPIPKSQQLLSECIKLIRSSNTLTESGYAFYIEVVHLLMVLFSGQVYQKETLFIILAMELDQDLSSKVVGRLLSNFLIQQPIPCASSWNFFSTTEKSSILADKSIILLLLLINQDSKGAVNNYRESLNSLVDQGNIHFFDFKTPLLLLVLKFLSRFF